MLNLIKPYDIKQPKVRLGPKTPGPHNHGDGGYVTNEIVITESVALFTYGVAGDIRYEEEYAKKYNKPAYLYDFTVDQPAEPAPGLKFKKEGIGINKPQCKDFLFHYNENKIKGDVLLKIDVEGAEYDYFINADIRAIADVTTGIILEVHALEQQNYRDQLVEVLTKLKPYYFLTHTHGNNWGGTFDLIERINESKFTGYVVPRVMEFAFTNKRYADVAIPDNTKYPIDGLDLPNNANIPDNNLDFLNDF